MCDQVQGEVWWVTCWSERERERLYGPLIFCVSKFGLILVVSACRPFDRYDKTKNKFAHIDPASPIWQCDIASYINKLITIRKVINTNVLIKVRLFYSAVDFRRGKIPTKQPWVRERLFDQIWIKFDWKNVRWFKLIKVKPQIRNLIVILKVFKVE